MLPLTTKVSELYQFVEKYIRENNKNRNMNMIIKNLLKADQRQVNKSMQTSEIYQISGPKPIFRLVC